MDADDVAFWHGILAGFCVGTVIAAAFVCAMIMF
jgi:hypothetical protein